MAKFRSAKEMARYVRAYGRVRSPHKAVLIDPNGGTECEVPSDQVQHYLNKGFRWAKS